MDVNLFLTNQQQPGTDQVRALQEQLEFVVAARDGGWDGIFAGQHYLSDPLTHIQPVPYLARLSAEAGDMTVGLGIFLLALHNPLDVAENLASLDVVTGGRLVVGVGLGYRDVEYAAFGIGKSGRVDRFETNLQIVQDLWRGDEVTVDLPWCRLTKARLQLRPVQQPRPAVWMAANSDGAVRRAARMADAWMVNPHATLETIQRQADLYRRTREELGSGPGAGLPVMREVVCAPTRQEAVELAARHLSGKYQTYATWGQDKVVPEATSFEESYEDLARDRFIVGTPDDCLAQLLPWRDQVGATSFVLRTHWAGMPAQHAHQSIELLSREVIPALRAAPVR